MVEEAGRVDTLAGRTVAEAGRVDTPVGLAEACRVDGVAVAGRVDTLMVRA